MRGSYVRFLLGTALLVLLAVAVAAAPPKKKGGKPDKPGKAAPPTKAQIDQGRALFATNCTVCHGVNGGGDDGPSLRQKHLDDSFVTTSIQKGFKDEMPAFGKKLSDKETKALVAFVHSLQ